MLKIEKINKEHLSWSLRGKLYVSRRIHDVYTCTHVQYNVRLNLTTRTRNLWISHDVCTHLTSEMNLNLLNTLWHSSLSHCNLAALIIITIIHYLIDIIIINIYSFGSSSHSLIICSSSLNVVQYTLLYVITKNLVQCTKLNSRLIIF